MASITFSIETALAGDALERVDKALAEPRPLLDDVGEHFINSTRDRFRTQTNPSGAPWKPLSPKYAKRKPRNRDKILTRDGNLQGQLVKQTNDEDVQIGSNLVYAGIHQNGGDIQKAAASMPIYRRQSDLNAGRLAPFVRRSQSDFESYHEVKAHTITMPQRAFLGVSAEDAEVATTMIGEYIQSAIDGS